RSRGQGDVDDDDQDQIDCHRPPDHEPGQRRLKRESQRDRQDHPGSLHSAPPPLVPCAAGAGVTMTSTSSRLDASAAGFTIMRLYAPPLFSTASTRPMTKPFG